MEKVACPLFCSSFLFLPPSAGKGATTWDGKNGDGELVAAGDYVIEIAVEGNGRTVISNPLIVTVSVLDCDKVELYSAHANTVNTFVAVKDVVWLRGDALGSNCSYMYNWDFKDGANSTQESPMHFYQTEGVYFPTLTASCKQCSPPPKSSSVKVVVGCPAEALPDPERCCLSGKLQRKDEITDVMQCPNRADRPGYAQGTHHNGCGTEWWQTIILNNPLGVIRFTEICYEHDEGYDTCNRPKADTDIIFCSNLLKACNDRYKDEPVEFESPRLYWRLYFLRG